MLAAGAALANPPQSGATGISGTVVDAAGGVVAQATVAVTSESTNLIKKDTTDQQGHFSVTGLIPGPYVVDVSATGFATESRKGVQVATGQTADISITLRVLTMNQAVTVEANDSDSVAAHLAPMDGLLDEHSARTEIKPLFVSNYTSPVADFGELVEMAPGTFSISTNGVGLAQDKTYFRGFPDGDYDIDFDGVPFYDTNTPTHHTWVFFPPPWTGSVDFDRSPGSASTIGPTPFGGSIHLLSPEMLSSPLAQASVSYGSFSTVFLDGHYDTGRFMGDKSNLSHDIQRMTSDGYQTYNYQTRNAGSAKYAYKFSDTSIVTAYVGIVYLDSNTPNNNPTRAQLAKYGDNFLGTNDCSSVTNCTDPLYYKFNTYHVPTDFEYVDWSKQLSHSWQMDFKPYTLAYFNAQYYVNQTYNADGLTYATGVPATNAPVAVDKLNSYRKVGDILTASQSSKYGVLRVGLWYEWAGTNRFQIPSDPQTHVDATLPNFHERFWTNSAQPFVEYEWRATHRLTVTAGFKYSYFNQSLQQYQDNGKTVGCLGAPGVVPPQNPKTSLIVTCPSRLPFVTHDAGYNSNLPSADASYRLTSNWSIYGQYATGTIVPPSSVFDVTGANVELTPKPTGALTFQGGTVVKLKDVTLNGDFYHTHFQNTYVAIPDPTNTSAVDYSSGGDSVSEGFEGEGTANLSHGLSFYVNGTVGTAKYVSNGLPSKGLWVANAPADTEALALTYQDRNFSVGIFEKRVGNMWNDNTATISINPNSSTTIANPVGYLVVYSNPTSAKTSVKITTNQVIPIAPFALTNFFFNYTFKHGTLFDGTKFRFSVNNLFDSHAIVGDSQFTAGANANPWAYIAGGADQLSLLPGRSVALTVTLGISPKRTR